MFHWFHDWVYSEKASYTEIKRVLLTTFAPIEVQEYSKRTCKKCQRVERKQGERNYEAIWVQIDE